jgi:hypothetical protein
LISLALGKAQVGREKAQRDDRADQFFTLHIELQWVNKTRGA